ncbi:MAG: TIGR02680 family protein [Clostridia bacterium]|nr:TIGR02680 family protein [Clostridia bacterium]
MDRWQINRAGIINFWYYDDDEFIFEDGKLLLRGANGSGKSVTMQSLVPLLFDGNKSPERLDPFGSKARKMDSYLLSEGLDLEERTGYLFLEFFKPESGRYKTIGMGMHARKNMPLNTWYFIVNDNRRLGAKYDLSLYKDIGDKIPLTQKELENKIGVGGNVFTRQGDYKKAVNDQLFGYDDLTDFDELITLLIQIRSPKLSKEFKPTTMYEILQGSLFTLTEEDLRPMSESIESMDGLKEKIDNLIYAKKAMDKIGQAFDKYNQYIISDKANTYYKHALEQQKLNKEIQKGEKNLSSLHQAHEKISLEEKKLEEEKIILVDREMQLKEHDLSKLSHEKLEIEQELKKDNEKKINKNKEIENLENEERYLINSEKEHDMNLEDIKSDFTKLYEKLTTFSELPKFDDSAFMIKDHEKLEKQMDFSLHKKDLEHYTKRVKEGLIAISAYEEVWKRYNENLKEKDEKQKAFESQERRVLDYEKQFSKIKEEFAEQLVKWHKDNEIFNFNPAILNKTIERVFSFGDTYDLEQIKSLIQEEYFNFKSLLSQEESISLGKRNLALKDLDEVLNAFEVLQSKKDVEPERSTAVVLNREKLQEKNIAFKPLYQVLDFGENIEDQMKNIIEESLMTLGLLDALVVDPKYRDEVLSFDQGLSDTYIFSEPNLLSHNLSEYLKVDKGAELDKALVDDVLKSIFLDASNSLFITEEGIFGNGILRGKASGVYESKFISIMSRKRNKEQMLQTLQKSIDEKRENITIMDEEIKKVKAKIDQLHDEYEYFPSLDDLSLSYKDWMDEVNLKQQLEKVYGKALELLELEAKKLKEAQLNRGIKTEKLYLKLTKDAYEEALEALDFYKEGLNELIHKDLKYWHEKKQLEIVMERKDRLEEKLDQVRYDLRDLDRSIHRYIQKHEVITEQLQQHDYKNYEIEVKKLKERLNFIDQNLKALNHQKNQVLIKKGTDEQELKRNKEQRHTVDSNVEIFKWALEEEWKLGYVSGNHEEDQIEVICDYILKTYGTILEEDKSLNDIRNHLQEKFMQEQGSLVEYNMKTIPLFKEIPFTVEDLQRNQIERLDIKASLQGKKVSFKEMLSLLSEQISTNENLLNEKDRELFEEILIKSISKKISAKIYHSEQWVNKIDQLMQEMDTSSGLKFSLKWMTKNAATEDQLSTKELVNILKRGQGLISENQREDLIKHFRSKIQESKNRMGHEDQRSFLAIMKDVLDYRKWFEFKLFYQKTGETKKELTNNAFFTFSGGEKAMAMYVPLFSAVNAKYQSGAKDCPTVISLDEAFAGVDERNIKDMFKLINDLKLSFVANSQVLFGDYETIPSLGIYELIRPENVTYVTLIRYIWNGKIRKMVI